MKIKRLLGGLVSLCLVAALAVILAPTNSQAATAPQAGGKEMGMHGSLQAAVESLNLTDDQKAKVKDIFADAKTKKLPSRDQRGVVSVLSLQPLRTNRRKCSPHQSNRLARGFFSNSSIHPSDGNSSVRSKPYLPQQVGKETYYEIEE